MPIGRGAPTQWPAAGERSSKVLLQVAALTKDTMGGRTEPRWTQFGVWWVKTTVVPFIVSDTQSSLIYQLEGQYRDDLMTAFNEGKGLRAIVNGLTLKVFQVENPQLRNRTLVAHCANATTTQ